MRLTRSPVPVLLPSFIALALAACSGSDKPAAPPEATAEAPAAPEPGTPEPVEAPEKSATQELMSGHFAKAADAREDLIKGDIDGAKVNMKWLAEHEYGDELEEDLKPLLTAMHASAAKFADAHTLRDAGLALALTLNRCGDCHMKAEAGPEIATPPLPDGKDARAHMQRHLWAAQRMWEGLVTRNDEVYNSGADVLAESPLHADDLVPGDQKETVAKLSEHLHELGKKARAAQSPAERAEVYGNFLATCATCHRLMPGAPAPDSP